MTIRLVDTGWVRGALHASHADNGGNPSKNGMWLGDLDSNQDYSGQSRRFYR